MSLNLQGRVALVTGASKGIGFAVAKALHERGARIVGLARNEADLKEAAAQMGADDGTFHAIVADVTDDASVRAAVADAVAWGGQLDILVNSAGPQLTPSPLAETDTDVLANYLNVKLLGFHRVAAAALPHISTSGTGRIINVSGQTATTFVPNAGVTGIVNAAVIAFSKYLAAEAAPSNILVNTISPGMTLTQGWLDRHDAMANAQGKTADEVRADLVAGAGIKIGRWAEPEEVAKTVVFLSSDLSSYLSGSLIEVDGGLSKAVM